MSTTNKIEQNSKSKLSDTVDKLDHVLEGAEGAIAGFPDQARDFYNQSKEDVSKMARQAKDRSYEMVKDYSTRLDYNVRKNPWSYIAAATLLGATIGFMLRKK